MILRGGYRGARGAVAPPPSQPEVTEVGKCGYPNLNVFSLLISMAFFSHYNINAIGDHSPGPLGRHSMKGAT